MKTIRWGIAGSGSIANKFANCIKNVEGAELVAVASRSEKTARDFALKHNIPNVFEGYDSLADFPDVDAIYVSTIHPFHKSCAEVFLNAKKHVLCEKPLCVNAAEAKELAECARKNGVFLMEAMWTRFLPAIIEAQKYVKSGKIGDVMGIKADFCYNCPPNEDPKLYDNTLAGGSLLDVGIYSINFASYFLGLDPESISAVADVRNGVDCHTDITFKYPNGAIASLTSAIALHKPEDAYIYGTKGHIYFPSFYGAQEFFVNLDSGEKEHIKALSIGTGFEEEIIECSNCIREGKTESDIHPLSDTIKVLKLMDAVREQISLKYPSDK